MEHYRETCSTALKKIRKFYYEFLKFQEVPIWV